MGMGLEALNLISSASPDISKKKILDVGCGTGGIISQFTHAFGLDIKFDFIKQNKELWPLNNFLVGNAENMPFPSETFDLIICTEVIEHVDDDVKLVKEIHRILSDSGYLVLSVPCNRLLFKLLDWQLWKVRLLKKGHHRHYSSEELKTKLKDFEIERCYEKGFLISPIFGLFVLPFHLIEKYALKTNSGPLVDFLRRIWAPLINFEYKFNVKRGDTVFVLAKNKVRPTSKIRE